MASVPQVLLLPPFPPSHPPPLTRPPTGRTVHLYNAHTGHFQHTLHGYPRYCYASDVAAPEFAQWAQDCLNTQQAEYNRLHAPESYGEGLSIRMTGMLLYNP